MQFWEIITVYTENHMKPINKLYRQSAELFFVKAGDTYSNHWALRIND
jgi:hypothetical protein